MVTRSIKSFALLFLSAMLLLVSCHNESSTYQTGDLLFVEGLTNGNMDKAIMESTGTMVHIGIVEVKEDSVYVIDAAPKTGVSRRPLDAFVEAQKDELGNCPTIKQMRLIDTIGVSSFIERAKNLVGSSYDFTFLPDNDKYYCSELVYVCYVRDGNPLFEAIPMNFCNSDGHFDPYWIDLFKEQEMEIPQGILGTNPNAMFNTFILKEMEGNLEK